MTINLNLAFINALPLPALDGGKALFVVVEQVLGRRLDEAKKQDLELLGAGNRLFFIRTSKNTEEKTMEINGKEMKRVESEGEKGGNPGWPSSLWSY